MSHEVDKFQWLADVAKSQGGEKIEQARQKAEMWRNSPFSWVYPLVSATKGKLGRELVVALCEDAGLNARQQGGDGMKIRVEGRLVSVKFSALGMNKAYIFENICDSGY